jgi:hypothetical protein
MQNPIKIASQTKPTRHIIGNIPSAFIPRGLSGLPVSRLFAPVTFLHNFAAEIFTFVLHFAGREYAASTQRTGPCSCAMDSLPAGMAWGRNVL